jgi:uncharacterized protein (DUF1015 family)
MIRIRPFNAWRPAPGLAAEVACVPYDVVDTDEARRMAAGNDRSFLRVVRPEIAFEAETDPYADAVYSQGRAVLNRFCQDGTLVQDLDPAFYIYRITVGARSQTGMFALVSTEDYDNGNIIRHELTRPDKEDDRTRHILIQEAHAEPVMLIAPRIAGLTEAMSAEGTREPLMDVTTEEGVRHRVWTSSSLAVRMLSQAEILYVADGHHRCKAASRAAAAIGADADHPSRFFPAVIFPQEQLCIMPYNRVLTSLRPGDWERFTDHCPILETGVAVPGQRGRFCAYHDGQWTLHELPPPLFNRADACLDVARIQNCILDPMFGIQDPRTDSRIGFVGGIRGTLELERLVDSGKADVAFSLHPTSIQDLVTVSDAGLIMPPKSTWFEPKLLSGLLIHRF